MLWAMRSASLRPVGVMRRPLHTHTHTHTQPRQTKLDTHHTHNNTTGQPVCDANAKRPTSNTSSRRKQARLHTRRNRTYQPSPEQGQGCIRPQQHPRHTPVLLNALNDLVGLQLVQDVTQQTPGRALEVLGAGAVAASATVHTGQHANTQALTQVQLAGDGRCAQRSSKHAKGGEGTGQQRNGGGGGAGG
jgi:hypothetical protein